MNNIETEQTLEFTGERFLPEMRGTIEVEHFHRYLYARQLIAGKRVLDIASGEGYGSFLMSEAATSVIGVDIAVEAIEHAREKYQASNLEYRHGSAAAIPLADASVDVVVSFETIEHHTQHEEMMLEIKRVLVPGGLLIMSCPDKLEYSDRPGYANPYHVKELYRDEFITLLQGHFSSYSLAGQRIAFGSVILAENGPQTLRNYDFEDESMTPSTTLPRAVYLIALASDGVLPPADGGVLEMSVSASDEVRMRVAHIENLDAAISERDNRLAAYVAAVEGQAGQLAHQTKVISALSADILERDGRLAAYAVDESGHNDPASSGAQFLRDQAALHAQAQATIGQLEARVAEQAAMMDELRQKGAQDVQAASVQAIAHARQLLEVQRALDELRQSTSWRVTHALRLAGAQWLRLKRLFGASTENSRARLSGSSLHGSGARVTPVVAEAVINSAGADEAAGGEVSGGVIPRIQFDDTRNRFVPHTSNPPVAPSVKVIAFYLPQFHPFPENDAWWGKGFTEWTNVGKAKPNYVGHYQPHCPIHNGYYDLRVPEVMEEQARLAKEYGVYGFSYYFYWFGGKILMDRPLEMMLANKKVDIPFCFTWANENWTRRWDGAEHDILIGQNHSAADSLDFIRHLIKYFADERYIRIDNKPVLIIYRASIIPDMSATAAIWREELVRHGIPGLYLVAAQSFGIREPHVFDFDAAVEFPPHTISSSEISSALEVTNPDFAGNIYDYEQVVANAIVNEEPEYKLYRTAMLSWDNTARKQNNSHIFHNFSLLRYKQWLSSLVNNVYSNKKYAREEKLVFVNAWNEWAEGTHLEPDQKFGFGYLQTTYDVLRDYDEASLASLNSGSECIKRHPYAVVLHLHYADLWADISGSLRTAMADRGFDLYVTVTSSDVAGSIRADYPEAHIELVENRGRDVLPFIRILEKIIALDYLAVCKLHSKRSVYRADGDTIRDEIFNALLGSPVQVSTILDRFSANKQLGMLVPKKYLIEHTAHNMTFDTERVQELAAGMDMEFSYGRFPAGSMFWFVPAALRPLLKIPASAFEIESGLADGTTPHAVERLFCLAVLWSACSVEPC